MLITPLHYGLLAPINYAFPRKVSVVSFTLVTVWMSIGSISNVLTGTQLETHDYTYSLVGAMMLAVIVSVFGIRSMKWALGADT